MKIILKTDVLNLGEEGDVCDVARGYARNYLLPKGLAVPYTRQQLSIFESKRNAIEKRKQEKREAAKSLKERLESLELEIKMPAGNSGKLFGSVSNATVQEELQKQGFDIERKKIDVPGNTLKMIGTYSVKIKLYGEEFAEVNLKVLSENEAAETEEKVEENRKKADSKQLEQDKEVTAETIEESAEEESEAALEEEISSSKGAE